MDTATEFAICTAPTDQTLPAISGDLVVWEDKRNGNDDIYVTRISLKEQ
jgi:beta propeller repeat protein